MIDWLTVVVPYRHTGSINGGAFLSITEDGETEWQRRKFTRAVGSFDATVAVRSSEDHAPGTHVWISGCPAKFLQGHNCFGLDCVHLLVSVMASKALRSLDLPVSDLDREAWIQGDFTLSMVDITEHYSVGSQSDCLAAIRHIGQHAHLAHRGGGVFKGDTVYFGKHSRRWSLKFYSKYLEVNSRKKEHQIPAALPMRDELTRWVEGDIRLELRLHTLELKKLNLLRGEAWKSQTPKELLAMHTAKLNISKQSRIPQKQLDQLPSGARLAYIAWVRGEDIRTASSRATFYRYRRALLACGVDIATPPREPGAQILDLPRIIRAEPKPIPEWAYGTPLLAAA